MAIQSAFTLTANEIYDTLANLIISQEVFSDNLGEHQTLVDKARVDGGLYGDTKLYYSTDALKSYEWANDAEATNLLALHRPDAPQVQAITLDIFRQIPVTVVDTGTPVEAVHIFRFPLGQCDLDTTQRVNDLGKAAEIHFHEGVDGDSKIQHHGFLQQGHSTKQVSVVHLVAAVTGDLYIHIAHERCHGQGVIPQVEGAKDHGVGKGTVVLVGSAILTNQHDIDDLLMLQKIIRRGGNGDLIRGDGDAGEVRGQGRVGIDIRGQGADGSAGITALGRVFDDDLTKCALDEDGDEEHGAEGNSQHEAQKGKTDLLPKLGFCFFMFHVETSG